MKEVRPTSGRVLLALFSILGPMEGKHFLDLFAGTGRVGLSALERGAGSVAWVESVRARAQAIERALPQNGTETLVLSLELRRAVSWLLKRERAFDVLFADPPYHEGWGAELLNVKGLDTLVSPNGVLVVEHSIREDLALPPPWALRDQRDYGETRLTFVEAR
ncbi:MAG: RsmD family RNA methyltransferase [Synergistaceae bacterium]|nr:RsmD family RNA methyltransferase [Synergistaceae bacterium]